MAQAVDYSFRHPAPGDIPAGGFVGAVRYLCPTGAPKRITKDEFDALTAAGVPVAFVFESTADRALSGAAVGSVDGAMSVQQLAELGAVRDFMFAAVDFAPRPDQYPALDAYFDSFGSHIRVEPYGDYDYIEHWCARANAEIGGWQTAAWSGNGQGSGGSIQGRRLSKHARMYQRVGYVLGDTSDANDILQADWGQQPLPGAHTGDDDMPPAIMKLADNNDVVLYPSSGAAPRILKNPATDIPLLAVFVYRVFEGHPGPADPLPVIDNAEQIAAIRADLEHGPSISGSFTITGAGQVG